jgi:chromosome segregation ATPase
MNPFQFLKNFGQTKAESLAQSGIEALAKIDPKGASQAELRGMEQQLDEIGKKLVLSKEQAENTHQKISDNSVVFSQRLAAAELLEKQLSEEVSEERQNSLNKSLETLVHQLEEQKNEIDQDKILFEEQKNLVDQLEKSYDLAAQKLKDSHNLIQKAERELLTAKLQKEQALEQVETAKLTAGLTQKQDTLLHAVQALQDQTHQAKREAEVALLKANALDVQDKDNDPNIAAAMAAITGEKKENLSLTHRLSSLKPQNQLSSLPSPTDKNE